MANSTSINYDNAYSCVNQCSKIATQVDELPKASQNGAFNILESLGLSNGFPSKFDRGMSAISDFITTLATGCSQYLDDVKNQDQSIIDDFVPADGSAGTYKDQDPGKVVRDPPSTDDSKSSGGAKDPKVNEMDEKEEDKAKDFTSKKDGKLSLSDEDYDVLVETLKELSGDKNIDIDKLLNGEYSEDIKQALLKSNKISKEFKAALEEDSSIDVVKDLKSLIDQKLEDFKNDEVMSSTLVDYLTLYAQKNNVTYDQLINDEVNIDLLRKGLEEFSKVDNVVNVVNQETIQQKLSDIYYGRSDADAPVEAVQSFVDNVSSSSNTESKDLLSNDSYKEKVFDKTGDLNEASKATKILSSSSQEQIIDTLKDINKKKQQEKAGEQ